MRFTDTNATWQSVLADDPAMANVLTGQVIGAVDPRGQ